MLLMTVQLLSSSVHVVNPWYVKTLAVSVSLQIIDCSTTLTYPWPNSCLGIFSSRKKSLPTCAAMSTSGPLPIAIAVIAALCVPGDGQYELNSVGIPVRSVHRQAFAAGISGPGTVLRLRGRGGDSSLLGVTEEVGIVPSNVGEDQAAEARGPALRFSFRELAQRRKREAAARENEQARRDGTNSEKYSLEWSLHGH
jgi:hypothetical protein